MFTLVLGGARSGKSTAAERLAHASGRPVVFVATATAGDDEMAARIEAHRRARPEHWVTIEEPVALSAAVEHVAEDAFLIVDCLTLWVNNRLELPDEHIVTAGIDLAGLLASRPGGAAVVSNEVGWGIVPDNALARRYRDLLGVVNARFADRAERTVLMVAGRAVELNALDHV